MVEAVTHDQSPGDDDLRLNSGPTASPAAASMDPYANFEEDLAFMTPTPEEEVAEKYEEELRGNYLRGGRRVQTGEDGEIVSMGPDLSDEEVEAWYASLPEDTQESLRLERDELDAMHSAAVILQERIPSLFRGRLPTHLEQRLRGQYAIGINQSEGAHTVGQAQAVIDNNNGIDLAGYGLSQRFVLIDKATADESPMAISNALAGGYYGRPDLGRFIVAIPVGDNSDGRQLAALVNGGGDEDFLQDIGFYADNEHDGWSRSSVSAKYVVGFIDSGQTFYENQNFGFEDQAFLASPDHTAPEPSADWI